MARGTATIRKAGLGTYRLLRVVLHDGRVTTVSLSEELWSAALAALGDVRQLGIFVRRCANVYVPSAKASRSRFVSEALRAHLVALHLCELPCHIDGAPPPEHAGTASSDTDARLLALLEQSSSFEVDMKTRVAGSLTLGISAENMRLAAIASLLSIEHASVMRSAMADRACNSAAALLRLQFEALLRAAWGLFAASTSEVQKLSQVLNHEAEAAAKNLPSLVKMLEAVVKTAPPGLSAPLEEFHVHSRHALNSFVHSGIHALRRAEEGFPVELALQLVRMSNGLLHFAYRMLASLTGSQAKMNEITRLHARYSDCLPLPGSQATAA